MKTKIKAKVKYRSIVGLIRQKTTLKNKEIHLLLDLFLFFIRRRFLENDQFKIPGFGIFYIKKHKRITRIKFKNLETLKVFINDQNHDFKVYKSIKYYSSKDLNRVFISVKKCTKADFWKLAYVFGLFVEGILNLLVADGACKLRNFGSFYLEHTEYKKTNVAGIPKTNFRSISVKFQPKPKFIREAIRLEEKIDTLLRVSRILKYNDIDFTIKEKKNLD